MPYKINPFTRKLEFYGERELSATLTANAVTNIVVGNKNLDKSVKVHYVATRGALSQTGIFEIINKDPSIDYGFPEYIGDDVGITTMAADINGNDIRLNATVDASSATDITFKYSIQTFTL